jgi:hypothetical protein
VIRIINKHAAIGYRFDQFRYGPGGKFRLKKSTDGAPRSRAVMDFVVISMGDEFPASSRPFAMAIVLLWLEAKCGATERCKHISPYPLHNVAG